MLEHETKCKEHSEKIKQLEASLELSRQTQQKLSESLERSQSELVEMSKKIMKKTPLQLEIDMSSLVGQEIKLECRRDCSVQTVADSNNVVQVTRDPILCHKFSFVRDARECLQNFCFLLSSSHVINKSQLFVHK